MAALGVFVCVMSILMTACSGASSRKYILYDVFSTAPTKDVKAALDGFRILLSYKVNQAIVDCFF